ncbi:Ferrichrome-iron receptor [Nitrospira sp. KM1]|uniref:TonB-dependent siderophore receptor n=1 Tax=Nitrospira sp. KM1 TaxID=1936990 RepID=UPI0013A764D3|nr:TonB-dependent receptor [Nitrospira sp. KM1]BCA56639.1 Ferrichrome-iron receptor [Nitrospira sp. KM1]
MAATTYDIPAQPLTSALNAFAETSGLQVSFPSELATGVDSPGLNGSYTPAAALDTLLGGTGLGYRYTNPHTVTLTNKQTSQLMLTQEQDAQGAVQADSPAPAATKPVKVPEVIVKDVRERDDTYVNEDASTATRLPVPIQDMPKSIETVTRQVISDQRVIRLEDALRNVSGTFAPNNNGGRAADFTIRGFQSGLNVFKNGFRDDSTFGGRAARDILNLQNVEVVKGPPSYLYGRSDPGGVINQITKDPLKTPYYSGEMIIGSYDLYRPTMDIGGPMNESKTLTYRLNALYETAGSYREGVRSQRIFIAPTLGWDIGSRTTLRFEGEYLYNNAPIDRGLVAYGNGVAPIPIGRFLGDPNRKLEVNQGKATLILIHQFNDMFKYRSAFRAAVSKQRYSSLESNFLDEATGDLNLARYELPGLFQSHYWQNEIHGKFATGSIKHTALIGVELGREATTQQAAGDFGTNLSFINIFNPNSRLFVDGPISKFNDSSQTNNILGAYFGDQIDLLDNLHLHAGGRFDLFEQKLTNRPTDFSPNQTTDSQTDRAFSPSVGLSYNIVKQVAVYANWTTSFAPQVGGSRSVDGNLFSPERGRSYEGGLKFQTADHRVRSTLAVFEITKKNVLTADPTQPPGSGFSVATGEQRSKGVEFDVAGQILPGWDVIGNYAYVDARVTQDPQFVVGSRLPNVPLHQGSLWTTYFFQEGVAKGFGAGIGMYAQGKRQGLLSCQDPTLCQAPFDLQGFVRMDAALYYRKPEFFNRTNLHAAINFTNLLDQRYFTGVGNFREVVYTGAPLTVIGSIKLEFN